MKVTRSLVLDQAYDTLRERGLSSLSMRRLAQDLGVAPGALYYHVASKQELLAAVAERILGAADGAATDPRAVARDLRGVLLRVRDGAEVVSFVQAFRPESLAPARHLRRLFAQRWPAHEAEWAARTVVHYVLGFVAEEQNRSELVRARIVADDPGADPETAFLFGVDVILAGLEQVAGGP